MKPTTYTPSPSGGLCEVSWSSIGFKRFLWESGDFRGVLKISDGFSDGRSGGGSNDF